MWPLRPHGSYISTATSVNPDVGAALASHSAELAAGSGTRPRCHRDGVVDEDDCDGGGGGEGGGVEDPVAGRGAIQEQRQLFAQLFGGGGAGLARGFGESRGKSQLVVAGVHARGVAGVVDLDGRRDERAQGRVNVEGGQQPVAGREVGTIE